MNDTTAAHDADAVQTFNVLIERDQLTDFRKTVDRLNVKAVRFGLPGIQVGALIPVLFNRRSEVSGSYQIDSLERCAAGQTPEQGVELLQVTISAPTIRKNGWAVVGKLETVEAGVVALTFADGGADDVRAMSSNGIGCQHCNVRRARKESFLLREAATGRLQQVGTTCLQDFAGIDPSRALFLANLVSVLRLEGVDPDHYSGGGAGSVVGVTWYVACVIYAIKRSGFLSAGVARERDAEATYSEALTYAWNNGPEAADARKDFDAARPALMADAEAIVAWGRALGDDGTHFERNCHVLMSGDTLNVRRQHHLAIVAGAVARQIAERREGGVGHPSEHVGTAGAKLDGVLLRVTRTVTLESIYGARVMFLMRDDAGNVLKWTTASPPRDLMDSEGRPFRASMKVKAHDEFRGTAQTAVTHLKFQEWATVA